MVEFIGRHEELQLIERFVKNGQRILCIEGMGGIGKTRLLQEVESLEFLNDKAIVCGIIDFDNPQLHVIDNISQEIVRQLSRRVPKEFFHRYWDLQDHRNFLETHQATPELNLNQQQSIQREFLDSLGRLTLSNRLVLRFDATDNLKSNTLTLEFLAWLATELPQVTLLVAGRNASVVLRNTSSTVQGDSSTIVLKPFSTDECRQYLDAKLSRKLRPLTREYKEYLIRFSKGRMVILDAAIEWLCNTPSPTVQDWMQNVTDAGELIDGFERNLFDRIRYEREDVDQLLLVLSKIYPLDKAGIQKLLGLSSNELQILTRKLGKLTFIKVIPGGYFKLHDEIEELVNHYVWATLSSERLEYTIRHAVDYLDHEVELLLAATGKKKRKADEEFRLFQYCVLLVRYQMRLDVNKGFGCYRKIARTVDAISNGHNLRFLMLHEILPNIQVLEADNKFEFARDFCQHCLSVSNNDTVVKFLETVLPEIRLRDRPAQIAEILLVRGHAYLGLGNITDAINDFEYVAQMGDLEPKLKTSAASKIAETRLLTGNLSGANQDFISALKYAVKAKNNLELPRILGKLATICALQGSNQAALNLVDRAVQICQSLLAELVDDNLHQRLGEVYFYAAKVYGIAGQPLQSINYFDLSAGEMDKLGIEVWQMQVRLGKGIALWLLRNYEEAEKEIQNLLENNFVSDLKPQAYLALGQMLWMKGAVSDAESLFVSGLHEATQRNDAYFEILLLAALARMAFEKQTKAFPTLQEFLVQFQKLNVRYPNLDLKAPMGALLVNLGHLYVKNKQFIEAEKLYSDGLAYLAGRDSTSFMSDYDLYSQLSFMHNRITRVLGGGRTRDLGVLLEKLWNDRSLQLHHPGAMMYFVLWQEGTIPRGLG